jgi:hypothetical protein
MQEVERLPKNNGESLKNSKQRGEVRVRQYE